MIIKKDICDDIHNDEIVELLLFGGKLDLSNFLYKGPGGYSSLPHFPQILGFIFRNEKIIYDVVFIGKVSVDIIFVCDVLVGDHAFPTKLDEIPLKTITIRYNSLPSIMNEDVELCKKIASFM